MRSTTRRSDPRPPEVGLLDGIEAVLFDMDGTLVNSHYDWKEIRNKIGVLNNPSIIDALNDLPAEESARRWAILDRFEQTATAGASLFEGVPELLALLREARIKTALVTNNNEANTQTLLKRFDLTFDTVVTRDSGLCKPSGAPLKLAMKELGVPADKCLYVGDSKQDFAAHQDASCRRILLLGHHFPELDKRADQALKDPAALLKLAKQTFQP